MRKEGQRFGAGLHVEPPRTASVRSTGDWRCWCSGCPSTQLCSCVSDLLALPAQVNLSYLTELPWPALRWLQRMTIADLDVHPSEHTPSFAGLLLLGA